MIAALWMVVAFGGGELHPMDAEIPPQPPVQDAFRAGRELGTPTTLFVNFDGIELDECTPSNSHEDCHWYNNDFAFAPFSGTAQTKIGVLQAMRRDAADYGIRITGVRPPDDENYTMVVYGGTEEEYDALGSAPSGDCEDQLPNEIAFAHVDGELNAWVNGGATTALHEAAHTWGLDHIDTEREIMFPAGNNGPASFAAPCAQVVSNTALDPGPSQCPAVNAMFCDSDNQQSAPAVLSYLFGPAYVDTFEPTVELVEPKHMTYFQAPADFEVVLSVDDDLHPQAYSMLAWVGGDEPPDRPQILIEPGFSVSALPVGEWDFNVIVADEAGNASKVAFTIFVGEDPPPEPEDEGGCGCRTDPSPPVALWLLGCFGLLGVRARGRKPR